MVLLVIFLSFRPIPFFKLVSGNLLTRRMAIATLVLFKNRQALEEEASASDWNVGPVVPKWMLKKEQVFFFFSHVYGLKGFSCLVMTWPTIYTEKKHGRENSGPGATLTLA